MRKKLGKKIREIRKQKGLSQEELSFRADLHRTYIGMVERGEKNIGFDNMVKISDALETELFNLFNFNNRNL